MHERIFTGVFKHQSMTHLPRLGLLFPWETVKTNGFVCWKWILPTLHLAPTGLYKSYEVCQPAWSVLIIFQE